MSVPILNASGCLDALTAPDVARSLDAFVTKTVTPLPREGNPPPRIAETDEWMLNSIGLQNPGIDAFVRDHLPRLERLGVTLWVSVGGFSAPTTSRTCAPGSTARGRGEIELNLSCPNVDEAPETAAELVAAARAATEKPLYAKLSPATSDIAESARAVVDAGADGLSLVNTIRGLALDRGRSARSSRSRPVAPPDRHSARSRSPASMHAQTPSTCRSWAWAGSPPEPTRWTRSPSARARSPSERSSSRTRPRPTGCVRSSPPRPGRAGTRLRPRFGGLRTDRRRPNFCLQSRKLINPCKSAKTVVLDQRGRDW